MEISKHFINTLCLEVITDYVLPYLDIDSRITCGFISKISLEFNKQYFEMKNKYLIARIPDFIHIGGKSLKNGIDFVLTIRNSNKFFVVEISEYHSYIHIADLNTFEKIYEDLNIT
jgi:hypothetical protein